MTVSFVVVGRGPAGAASDGGNAEDALGLELDGHDALAGELQLAEHGA